MLDEKELEEDANRLAEALTTFHTIFCSAYGTYHKVDKVFQSYLDNIFNLVGGLFCIFILFFYCNEKQKFDFT